MTAKSLREKVFTELEALGFRPAQSLPMPELDLPVRPPHEVAARLMALDALFTWVAYLEDDVTSDRIQAYVDRNRLREWLTEPESEILSLTRAEARDSHINAIGWKLENMWALAWVLGFDPEPTIEAAQVSDDITQPLIHDFLPGLDRTVADLLAKAIPRPREDVIALEYRFYCAHNAVRSAQLGRKTVPSGFHPIIHGGAVHERRHSLSWCVAPHVVWEDTDLST